MIAQGVFMTIGCCVSHGNVTSFEQTSKILDYLEMYAKTAPSQPFDPLYTIPNIKVGLTASVVPPCSMMIISTPMITTIVIII